MTTQLLEKPLSTQPKINAPYQKEEILNRLAVNEPHRSIARDFNVSHPRITQINKENKEVIDQKKQELIKQLPNIVDSVKADIETNNRLSKHISLDFTSVDSNLIALKNTLDKTNVNILKIAGIFPSQALLNFNQYNQDNRQVNVEPSIMGLFSGGFKDSMEVIDMNEVSDSDSKP